MVYCCVLRLDVLVLVDIRRVCHLLKVEKENGLIGLSEDLVPNGDKICVLGVDDCRNVHKKELLELVKNSHELRVRDVVELDNCG